MTKCGGLLSFIAPETIEKDNGDKVVVQNVDRAKIG